MDKVIQILIVFGLVVLLIYRFIRGRGPHYLPYDFILRLRAPLGAEVEARLIVADRVDGDGFEASRNELLFCYRSTGSLTIYRRDQEGGARQMQEIAVPVDCAAMAVDPVENKIYFEAGGYWFVYGAERAEGRK